MENTEEYLGWPNRETWALNLWLTNDYTLNETLNDLALNENDQFKLGILIKKYTEDMLLEGMIPLNMQKDVGSFWRVDYEHIAGSVLSGIE